MESLRGSLMVDVSNGKIRLRKWPRKRPAQSGKGQSEAVETFSEVNRVFSYFYPGMIKLFMDATEGTPILPRDLATAMAFNRLNNWQLPDGKVIYPMTARNDVSEALDTISQTPGTALVRGEKYWEPLPLGNLGQAQEVMNVNVGSATPFLIASGLDQFQYMALWWDNVKGNLSANPAVRISTNHGASFYSVDGDYRNLYENAATDETTAIYLQSANTTLTRGAALIILNTPAGLPSFWINPVRGNFGWLQASFDPITNLRIFQSTGEITAGRIRVIGW